MNLDSYEKLFLKVVKELKGKATQTNVIRRMTRKYKAYTSLFLPETEKRLVGLGLITIEKIGGLVIYHIDGGEN